MAIRIVPYTADLEQRVREFNVRLEAAGITRRFPVSHVSKWLPRQHGSDLYQESFLAVDDQSNVRGGYILKHQWFFINGTRQYIADYQLPISEGIVDRRFGLVGISIMEDAIQRQPRLFGLGFGGLGTRTAQYVHLGGWPMVAVPFLFRIAHPNTFLRNIRAIRTSAMRCWSLDFLAGTGVGWLGITLLRWLRPKRKPSRSVCYEEVLEFSDWVDAVWEACAPHYRLIAVRDCATLQTLYPRDDQRFIRLKIVREGKPIGWAVMLNTAMADHKHFGNMRVGTLVDCLASPKDAPDVVACARDVLEARGADILVSNQSSGAWCASLRACGFMEGPSNFGLTVSPQLAREIAPLEENIHTFHLNRGDGDGPIHL